jgi:Farnesoic acid 0-methyl transferase
MTVSTPNILDLNNFNSFWISWINGIIQVGKGNAVGDGMFMSYNDTSPSAVNYVSFAGVQTTGSAFFNDGLSCNFPPETPNGMFALNR